jgi:hypothetical protein
MQNTNIKKKKKKPQSINFDNMQTKRRGNLQHYHQQQDRESHQSARA